MKGMLIAFSVVLLCSCKHGAWPLHSAYKLSRVNKKEQKLKGVHFVTNAECAATSMSNQVRKGESVALSCPGLQQTQVKCVIQTLD